MNDNTIDTDAVEYGNSDQGESEYSRLLAAAIAAGVLAPNAQPKKLALMNGQWYIEN